MLGSSVESLRPDDVRIFEFGQEADRCGQSSFLMTPRVGVGDSLAQAVTVLATAKTAKIALVIVDLHAMHGRLSNVQVLLQAHLIVASEASIQKWLSAATFVSWLASRFQLVADRHQGVE